MNSISIIEAVNTSAVQFHGQQIITAMAAGVAYVAMKPIVENLGMSWSTQFRKLNENSDKFNCVHMNMVALDKKLRDVICIPLRKLNGWLFSINPSKVRHDIRSKLIAYQEECFSVLYEYWTKGDVKPKQKSRNSTSTQLTPLRQTAERLITTGLGRLYPDIWKLVHQRFDIEHINQLRPEQIGEAIDYLNALEGELMEPERQGIQPNYLVCVRIKDEITGGEIEFNLSAETVVSLVTGISTCLGYAPTGFNKVPVQKQMIRQIH